jgi:Insertion element 4 transposase N-terminal
MPGGYGRRCWPARARWRRWTRHGWSGALELLAGGDVIAVAVAREERDKRSEQDKKTRCRVLTGAVTVAVILGLCLFRRDNYDVVLARVMGLLPGALAPGDGPPSGQALSEARERVVGEPVREVFERTAGGATPGRGRARTCSARW